MVSLLFPLCVSDLCVYVCGEKKIEDSVSISECHFAKKKRRASFFAGTRKIFTGSNRSFLGLFNRQGIKGKEERRRFDFFADGKNKGRFQASKTRNVSNPTRKRGESGFRLPEPRRGDTTRGVFPCGDSDVSAPNFRVPAKKSAKGAISNSIGQAKRRPMFADKLLSSPVRAQAVRAGTPAFAPTGLNVFSPDS